MCLQFDIDISFYGDNCCVITEKGTWRWHEGLMSHMLLPDWEKNNETNADAAFGLGTHVACLNT